MSILDDILNSQIKYLKYSKWRIPSIFLDSFNWEFLLLEMSNARNQLDPPSQDGDNSSSANPTPHGDGGKQPGNASNDGILILI